MSRALVVTVSNRAAAGVYADRAARCSSTGLRGARLRGRRPLVVPDGTGRGGAARRRRATATTSWSPPAAPGSRPTDRTPEVTRRVVDREVPGIAEAIRAYGVADGVPTAVLSRGLAGRGRAHPDRQPAGSTGGGAGRAGRAGAAAAARRRPDRAAATTRRPGRQRRTGPADWPRDQGLAGPARPRARCCCGRSGCATARPGARCGPATRLAAALGATSPGRPGRRAGPTFGRWSGTCGARPGPAGCCRSSWSTDGTARRPADGRRHRLGLAVLRRTSATGWTGGGRPRDHADGRGAGVGPLLRNGSACTAWRSTSGRRTSPRRRVVEKLGFRDEGCARATCTSTATGATTSSSPSPPRRCPADSLRRWVASRPAAP